VPRFAIAPLGLTTEGSTKFKLKGWKCYLKKLQCKRRVRLPKIRVCIAAKLLRFDRRERKIWGITWIGWDIACLCLGQVQLCHVLQRSHEVLAMNWIGMDFQAERKRFIDFYSALMKHFVAKSVTIDLQGRVYDLPFASSSRRWRPHTCFLSGIEIKCRVQDFPFNFLNHNALIPFNDYLKLILVRCRIVFSFKMFVHSKN